MKKFIYIFNCLQNGGRKYITADSLKEAVDQYQKILNQHPYFTYSKNDAKDYLVKRVKNYDLEDTYTLIYRSKSGTAAIYDGPDEKFAITQFNQLNHKGIDKRSFLTDPDLENRVIRLVLYKHNRFNTEVELLISEPFIMA